MTSDVWGWVRWLWVTWSHPRFSPTISPPARQLSYCLSHSFHMVRGSNTRSVGRTCSRLSIIQSESPVVQIAAPHQRDDPVQAHVVRHIWVQEEGLDDGRRRREARGLDDHTVKLVPPAGLQFRKCEIRGRQVLASVVLRRVIPGSHNVVGGKALQVISYAQSCAQHTCGRHPEAA